MMQTTHPDMTSTTNGYPCSLCGFSIFVIYVKTWQMSLIGKIFFCQSIFFHWPNYKKCGMSAVDTVWCIMCHKEQIARIRVFELKCNFTRLIWWGGSIIGTFLAAKTSWILLLGVDIKVGCYKQIPSVWGGAPLWNITHVFSALQYRTWSPAKRGYL